MILIRKAYSSDIAVIQALAHAIWPIAYANIITPEQITYMLNKMYSTESLEQQINVAGHTFLLAYDRERPVGFCAFSFKSHEEPFTYRLHKLYVETSCHGKGIGKQLLSAVIQNIEPGIRELELNVNRQNPAVHFYLNNGFRIKKEEDLDNFVAKDFVQAFIKN